MVGSRVMRVRLVLAVHCLVEPEIKGTAMASIAACCQGE
jgi:hypothetical protein